VEDGDKGDITVSGTGAAWAIDAGVISLAKLADLAQAKLIGRWTASTGAPEAITIGADFLTTAGTLSLAVAPQPLDADLTYLAGFTPSANVKSLLNAADYSAIRTLLSLVPGTNVAGLSTTNVFTGTNTFGNVTAAAASVWNLTAATLTLPPISGALEVTTEAYDATGWNADNSVPTKDAVRDKIEALDKTGIIGFTASDSSAVATGKVKGFVVCPYAGTISGWSIVTDAGTATVKVWKIASGTAKPTIANVINTSGVALASGTAAISTTVTDFTSTAVTANDIFAFDITAASGVTEITFQLKITKS
jgi:hypothetical protein